MVPVPEAGRYYSRQGILITEVPSSDGTRMVAPTIVHARKLGLLPSVTTIIRQLEKPGLRAWRDQQLIAAALSLPQGDVPDEIWNDPQQRAALVLADAQVQVEQAAQAGKDWHTLLEQVLAGWQLRLTEAEQACCSVIKHWLTAELGYNYFVETERTVVRPADGWASETCP